MTTEAFPASLESMDTALAFARREAPEWVSTESIDFGLTELLTNAIVHGSTSSDGGEPMPGATFSLSVEVCESACAFTVTWSAVACPSEARVARTPDVWETSGRGLLIAEAMFDRLVWREDGLAITGEIARVPS